jgi:Ca2+/H+ antiporter
VTWLLALIPIAVALDWAAMAAPLVFLVAALAIVPLAALIVHSTEQLAEHTGRATWFKGIQLLAVYLVIAGSVYWLPVVAP